MTQEQQDQLDEIFNDHVRHHRIPNEQCAAAWDLAVAAVQQVLSVEPTEEYKQTFNAHPAGQALPDRKRY